jgi:hypothetical protein
VAKLTIPSALRPVSGMVFRTRVIVRLGTLNRMVTKGYQKGVYDRVTAETHARQSDRHGDCRDLARYVSDFR